MRVFRRLALGASVFALALSACSTGGGGASPGASGATGGATVKIGSDGFDEARVVAEVYAQALEAAGFTVDRAGIGMGPRPVTKAALESGEINIKPEYIGSGLVAGYGGEATTEGDTNKRAAPGEADAAEHHRAELHARPGHERLRRPPGDRRPSTGRS